MDDSQAGFDLGPAPDSVRRWWGDLWRHREVLSMLARADFHVRYKRASFGVAWAVVVPLIQGVVLAFVFSKVIRAAAFDGYSAYVISGILAWSYFNQTISVSSIAIVEGSGLTDKVWFPRAMLAIVPAIANSAGLAVSMVILLPLVPLLGGDFGPRLLILLPACLLLVAFTTFLSMALSALHVYFRDVKFLVAAALLVWFYVTPVAYPKSLLGGWARVIDLNPMTGIINLFQMAVVASPPHWTRAVAVSLVATAVLAVVSTEAQRRHDRLFVDLL
ncbi:MAG: lipopolysaccharide transport system permease protein [Actinomycetota bacterium]|jgi:ABC-type polysaccharide/polyol phosphate export permease